jgi:hypothetical protein
MVTRKPRHLNDNPRHRAERARSGRGTPGERSRAEPPCPPALSACAGQLPAVMAASDHLFAVRLVIPTEPLASTLDSCADFCRGSDSTHEGWAVAEHLHEALFAGDSTSATNPTGCSQAGTATWARIGGAPMSFARSASGVFIARGYQREAVAVANRCTSQCLLNGWPS